MTILARTTQYLVEFEAGFLSISRYSDGYCKAWKYPGIAGDFRKDLSRCSSVKAVDVYLKLLRRADWEPLYKPERMPGADPEWDAATGCAEILTRLDAEERNREVRRIDGRRAS